MSFVMTKTALCLSFLGLTFAAFSTACSAQTETESEPTGETSAPLQNNGYNATECGAEEVCYCQGETECQLLAMSCYGYWYCNDDASGHRCQCWNHPRAIHTRPGVTTTVGTSGKFDQVSP